MADRSLQQKPGLRCCPRKVCEFNLALVLSGALPSPRLQHPDHTLRGAISQATTLLSCHRSRESLHVSLQQRRRPQGCCPEAQPSRANSAARHTVVFSGGRAVVGFARLSKQGLLCDSLAAGTEQPQWKPPGLPDKAVPGTCAPHFLHAGGRACLSVHPALAWFSGSGTLSLRVKGWDPLPTAQPGKPGPDIRAPPGMQSRGHGNGDFPAGPRPRASAPCAGRCTSAPESRLGGNLEPVRWGSVPPTPAHVEETGPKSAWAHHQRPEGPIFILLRRRMVKSLNPVLQEVN